MELNNDEIKILEQAYGRIFTASLSQVKEVRELTEGESRFFEKDSIISSHFCVHTLYKVSGKILPINFTRAVKNMIDDDETFRTNYCNVGTRTVKVIFNKRDTLPEIIYRSLTQAKGNELDEILVKIMEADTRSGFDILRGHLIRFAAFHTDDNEYAVLITMSQLIFNNFNSKSFFNSVLEETKYQGITKITPIMTPASYEDRVRNYWAKVLKDLPPKPKVPFSAKYFDAYKETIYNERIPEDILSDLMGHTQSNLMLFRSILQSAWGFMLQATNNTNDVVYFQLISNITSDGAFSSNLMPVRQNCMDDQTVDDVINHQFRQFVISQQFSLFDWHLLKDLDANNALIPDHFLSFLSFKQDDKTYSTAEASPEGNFIARHSWNAQGTKLGVHFQYSGRNLYLTFIYDANKFNMNAGERLAKLYNLVLRQMLVYWDAPIQILLEHIRKQMMADVEQEVKLSRDEEKKIMINFVSTNKILQGETYGATYLFTDFAKLVTLFEGDRLHGHVVENNLIFIVDGILSRSFDTGDGWYRVLDILEEGAWINETVFLPEKRLKVSAEVLSDRAVVMLIPLTAMVKVWTEHPEVMQALVQHTIGEMEKFQLLWLEI